MKRLILVLFFTLVFASCLPTTQKLSYLQLDMTKSETTDAIGPPVSVRGSIKNKYNQIVDVWEYELYKKGRRRDYWLFFVGDRLVQWGEAGDWNNKNIYEIRFR